MRRALLFFALSLQLSAAATPEFAQRRAALRKELSEDILVLFGNKESEDLHEGFFQETNFLYLTGWEEPGAILVMTPEPAKDSPGYAERLRAPREILFLPQRDLTHEKWTGRKLGPDDAATSERTGFTTVMASEKFESQFRALLDLYATVYSDARTAVYAPGRTLTDPKPLIAKQRMKKSASEIALIQRATDASVEAHRAAWKMLRPGLYEYEIAAVMAGTYMMEGCRRGAYAPIVGSGPNSTVLHYSRNSRRMDSGEVVVMDVAGECENYASDITRTLPANGRFTGRQREIYEIVLGARNAAIAAAKPGMTIGKTTPQSLYKIALDYINTHGKDSHGEPLGKYFIHGLSHHVGLDVHDASDTTAPLEAGMVITIEPGVYIPEESLGVRIEDVVLITETGAKVLSAALPADPAEVEHAMGQHP